jgi:hypothetical protein
MYVIPIANFVYCLTYSITIFFPQLNDKTSKDYMIISSCKKEQTLINISVVFCIYH